MAQYGLCGVAPVRPFAVSVSAVTEFGSAFGIFTNSHPNGITAGPDGNLWFTE